MTWAESVAIETVGDRRFTAHVDEQWTSLEASTAASSPLSA